MKWINIRHYKRGARWPDGTNRMCTRCGVRRRRRRQAVVTAEIADGRYRVPVGYCEDDIPLALLEDERLALTPIDVGRQLELDTKGDT